MLRQMLLILACSMLLPVVARGLTLHVPGDHQTIQAALDAATAGDSVVVAPGTYTGEGNRDLLFRGKDLILWASGGPEVTWIDVAATAEDPHRGFLFAGESGELESRAAVLDGFTIVNGLMTTPGGDPTVAGGGAHDLSGAGIMIRLFASPTIRNCIIRNCHSEFTGGGIGVEFGSDPLIENCRIESCSAGIQGGGVSIETAAQSTFVGCIIIGCRSRNGGGAHLGERSQLLGCLVAGNAAERGGGLDIVFPAEVTIRYTVIWNNCAEDGSGAAFVDPVSLGTSIECSIVDLPNILDTGGRVSLVGENLEQDPLFCGPADCASAPTAEGSYLIREDSPARIENSPCGEQIGPLGVGCLTALEKMLWGEVKSIYR